jgi:hypothetical protein
VPLARRRKGGLQLTHGGMIEPGMRVRHPQQPGWGVGQVQSVIGERVTVNFENRGKLLINTEVVDLDILPDG